MSYGSTRRRWTRSLKIYGCQVDGGSEAMKFGEWKLIATYKLINLYNKYQDQPEITSDLNLLIIKLKELRARDLANFLIHVHMVHQTHNLHELQEIIPSASDLEEMMKRD
jgi:hypothetical protein